MTQREDPYPPAVRYPTQPPPPYPPQAYPSQPYPPQAYPAPPYAAYPAQPYPGLPGPPAPARTSRVGLWIGLGAGTLVLFLAVAVGAFALVRIVARPTPAAPDAAQSDLLALVLPMPPGATAQSTDAGPDGTLEQDELAKWYGDQVYGRELLDAHGFEAAVQRAWKTSDGTLIQVTLIRFGEPSRAYSFAADWANAILMSEDASSQGPLSAVDIGRYYIAKEADGDGAFATASVFAKRSVVGVVNGWYARSPSPDTVTQLAMDQHARLP